MVVPCIIGFAMVFEFSIYLENQVNLLDFDGFRAQNMSKLNCVYTLNLTKIIAKMHSVHVHTCTS